MFGEFGVQEGKGRRGGGWEGEEGIRRKEGWLSREGRARKPKVYDFRDSFSFFF